MPNTKNPDTSNRGFASMPKEKVSEIAHKGGEARAKEMSHEDYAEMGRKGGEKTQHNRHKETSK